MTQKEKAKRYDEALERAKKWYNAPNVDKIPTYGNRVIEEIFPELKESEDERIRKELIKTISSLLNNTILYHTNITKEEALAWLEKQSKIDEDLIAKRFLINKGYPIDANGTFPTYEELYNIIRDGLENQGEQKLADKVEPKNYSSIDPHFFKTTDMVEPKFHEGEWIIHHGTENIYQVVAIIDNQYQLKYGDNYTIQNCADVDRCARLWDITKDAKDGDVLACESGWTCIFKTLVNDENFSSYCFMDSTKWFCETGSECHTLKEEFVKAYNGKIHPATKEQRDALMKAMADAGYEWDAEKKELKKIEQKPQRMVSADAKEAVLNEKVAWSEEDESYLNTTIAHLKDAKEFKKTAENCINWLKSLRPQNRLKPSDKQMDVLLSEVIAWTKGYPKQIVLESLYNDLKKLKG